MSHEIFKIFVVDDDPVSRMIIVDDLKEFGYEIHEFENGKDCLNAINLLPDLVLMDVEMPVMNGYEACHAIKDNAETNHIDVIFISSHDTTEEKVKGYDAGASDYVIKPIQLAEIQQKVAVSKKDIETRRNASSEMQSAIQTAMSAISNAGEQGVVLDFMRRSFSIDSVEALGRLVVEGFSGFGVETTVQIRASHELVNCSSREPIAPLEAELLTRLKDAGRIQESGQRLIANFGKISLLIRNMPEDDDKRGRLRDHLALLLEGAEACLKALEMDYSLAQTVARAKQSLHKIEEMQEEQKKEVVVIIDRTMANLEECFMSLGLTEEQEHTLLSIVQAGSNESLNNFDKAVLIDEELKTVISDLQSLLKG